MIDLLRLPSEYHREEWKTCLIPGRPWWVSGQVGVPHSSTPSHSMAGYAVRSDGERVRLPPWGVNDTYDTRRSALISECVKLDQDKPIAHPGFRPGQVWALFFQQTTFVVGPLSSTDISKAAVEAARDGYHRENAVFHRLIGEENMLSFGPFKAEPLAIDDIKHTVLIADPCRSDLTPWSSR